MSKSHYQRFNVNMIGLTYDSFCRGNEYFFYVVLSFHRRELVGDFDGKSGIKSLKIFSKSSAVNGFDIPLPTTV